MKRVGQYELMKEIGHGSYGSVYEAQKQNNHQKFAIKMIHISNLQQRQIDLVQMEISVLQKINHSNIIKLIDVMKTKNNYYLVLEYCDNGDLEKFIKKHYQTPLKQRVIQKLIYNISDALKVLHQQKIVHRDIKLANILLTKEFDVRLSDFGFAKNAQNQMLMETYCGTPMNMAPQILLRQQYSLKCDIWSLGVVTYQLAYGKLPFSPGKGKGLMDLIQVIQKYDKIQFPIEPIMPDNFKKLINDSLQKDPQKRINIQQFFMNQWVQQGKDIQKELLKQFLSIPKSFSNTTIQIEFQIPLIKNFIQINDDQNHSAQLQITLQKSIAWRIYSNIQCQLIRLSEYLEQMVVSINQLGVKPELFRKLRNSLYYSYIKDIQFTPIKVTFQGQSFQFKLSNIKSLSDILKIPQEIVIPSPFQKTIHLLQTIAQEQKNTQKEKSLQDYKTMLKLLFFYKRVKMEVTAYISSTYNLQNVNLKSIQKYFLEEQFSQECQSGVTIHTQYQQKHPQFVNQVQKLKKICEQRVADVENQILQKE